MNDREVNRNMDFAALAFIIGVLFTMFLISTGGEFFHRNTIKEGIAIFQHGDIHYIATFTPDTAKTFGLDNK